MQDRALCGRTVLVVEDELVMAQSLQEALEHAGAEVVGVGLRDAPERIQRQTPSAVVLDCHPPSAERRALIRQLRRLRLPYLFYGIEPPLNFTTERAAPFIAKSCTAEKIVAAVRYLLGML